MSKNIDYVEQNNDIIILSELLKLNISKEDAYKYIKDNDYEKIDHGIYSKKDVLVDDLFVLFKKIPHLVFSHEEALYHYGLIEHEPSLITFTVYSGYNTHRLKSKNIKVFSVKKELVDLGKTFITDEFNYVIPMYDLERTIVDLIRNRSYFEIEDFKNALKNYFKRSDKDLGKLFKYSKEFKVDKILKDYLEILL